MPLELIFRAWFKLTLTARPLFERENRDDMHMEYMRSNTTPTTVIE
jgi:hypothetical protein